MNELQFAFVVFSFVLLLLLNIFFLYIPLNKVEQALIDIDNKVEEVTVVVKPVVDKLTPLIESLL